ncbi:isocitrate dehydrogenase kinase/phosphatase AceK regulatory subunit [Undibacterium arcticum]
MNTRSSCRSCTTARASWCSTRCCSTRNRSRCCFRFTRAYFQVDMEVPSAYVQFLRTLLPKKPRSEIYTVLGLQKQGKALFYRDYLHHLRNSSDRFESAPPASAGW